VSELQTLRSRCIGVMLINALILYLRPWEYYGILGINTLEYDYVMMCLMLPEKRTVSGCHIDNSPNRFHFDPEFIKNITEYCKFLNNQLAAQPVFL
jgi:hypothetical protein